MQEFLKKCKEMADKIYCSDWFLMLIEILFLVDLVKKDIWGSLTNLFILTLIAIFRSDKK